MRDHADARVVEMVVEAYAKNGLASKQGKVNEESLQCFRKWMHPGKPGGSVGANLSVYDHQGYTASPACMYTPDAIS